MNLQQIRALVLIGSAFSVVAAAAPITGTIYQNNPNSTNASIAPPTTLPSATFTVNQIFFEGTSVNPTALSFFSQPGTGFSGFTNLQNGFNPNASFYNSFVRFTGQVYLNAGSNLLQLAHDDGAVLRINGANTISMPSNLSSGIGDTTTFTAPFAGLYNFTLDYAEQGGPGVIKFTANGPFLITDAPEPASFGLFGLALTGLALVRRSRKS